jgi:SagB-type dehydrogenase family enzyme
MPKRAERREQTPAGPPAWPVARIVLPKLQHRGGPPLEEAFYRRRSMRDFSGAPATLEELSRLLWSAQGVTGLGGLRTAPSAGALFPLKLYCAVFAVEGLAPGIYRYDPDSHELEPRSAGQRLRRVQTAAMAQLSVEGSAVACLIAGWYGLSRREFGEEAGRRLALIEAGHAGQNWLLEAPTIGLGGIGLSKFDPDLIASVFEIRPDEQPLYLLLAGRPAVTSSDGC